MIFPPHLLLRVAPLATTERHLLMGETTPFATTEGTSATQWLPKTAMAREPPQRSGLPSPHLLSTSAPQHLSTSAPHLLISPPPVNFGLVEYYESLDSIKPNH